MNLKLTKKQHEIMDVIITGVVDEEGKWKDWCTTQEVIDRLSYSPSRGSLVCSLRFLTKKGLVERGKRRLVDKRWRSPIMPTNLALDVLRPPVDDFEYTELDGIITIE